MTNSRRRFGSRPRATRSSSSALATTAFSVAPSRRPRTCLCPVGVHAHGADHVVGAELDAVDPDGQDVEPGEVTLGQLLQEPFAGLDRLAGDLALGDADRLGHLGEDLLVASGRDAVDEDLEHPIGEPAVLAHGLVGGDLDLSGLSRLGGLASRSLGLLTRSCRSLRATRPACEPW